MTLHNKNVKFKRLAFILVFCAFFCSARFSAGQDRNIEYGNDTRLATGSNTFANIPTSKKDMPKILVFIAERDESGKYLVHSDSTEISVCESVVKSNLLQDGFILVDPLAESIDNMVFDTNKDNFAVNMGKETGAEIVIMGEVAVKSDETVAGTAMRSFQADIAAKAIRTRDGVVVASTVEHALSVNADDDTGKAEAVKVASEKTAADLKHRIMAGWQEEKNPLVLVSLTIRGIKSCPDFVEFRDALKGMVEGNVYYKSIGAGLVRMDVETQRNAEFFADRLSKEKFRDFSLNAKAVTANSIEMDVVSKEKVYFDSESI
jgi:hypothetical protein